MLRNYFRIAASVVVAVLVTAEPMIRAPGADARSDADGLPGVFLSSPVNDARLLAAFGEAASAYSVLPVESPDPDVEYERRQLEARLLTEMGRYARADSLLGLAAPVSDPVTLFRYHLRRGKINLLAERYERALEALSATDSLDGAGLEPYRDRVRVDAHLALGRPERAFTAGVSTLENGVPPALSPEFEKAMIEAYALANRPETALDVLSQLRRRTRLSTEKADLLAREYRLRIQAGDRSGARKAASRLARRYRNSPRATEVGRDAVDRYGAAKLSVEELLAFAGAFVARGDLREARTLLRALDEKPVRGAHREERLIVKARYYYARGDYKTAAALAKPRYSAPAYRRESILILARSYRRLGMRDRAADLYVYFADVYPNDAKAAEALFVASRLYENGGNRARAGRIRDRLRRSYPSSYFGKVAVYETANRYASAGRHNQSIATLEREVRRSRRTDETALYYLAQTYYATRNKGDYTKIMKELNTLDPYSFYLSPFVEPVAWRPVTNSTGRIALDGDDGLIAFLLDAAAQKDAARRELRDAVGGDTGLDALACIERGEWFLSVGFRDWGERELEAARRYCLDSPAALLELGRTFDDYGMPWRSIRVYQRVKDSMHWKKRREYAAAFRYLMYPVPYPVHVLENAARFDLPPHLVYAMIREESRFDERAVSRVGALGLMQLMPETGRYVARELEIPGWIEGNLLDPATNVAFGVWYASSLLEKSDDDYLRMLAAYNAGPGNANRWFGRPPRRDGRTGGDIGGGQIDATAIEMVDGIDFKETRLYVQRIVESARVYHSLYFDPGRRGAASGD